MAGVKKKNRDKTTAVAELFGEGGPLLSSRFGRWLGRAAIVLLTLVAYFPMWRADFIWDDPDYIINNMTLRNLGGLWSMWVHPLSIPQYYPLVHTTFWIEYHLWQLVGLGGLWPVGYHIDNVLLHAIGALVLWEILDVLEIPGAVLAAGFFALHPVHVESVAWVTERKNVLSGLLYLLSLQCFLRQGIGEFRFNARWYAAALLLFIGALLSKSVTCTLPVVILILAWWKTGRIDIRRLSAVGPMLAIGGAMALVTAYVETHHVMAVGHEWLFSRGDRLVIAGRAAWFYPLKLLWPANLVFVYPKWTIDHHDWKQLSAPALILLATVMLWLMRKRLGRWPLAAWMFYLVTILPALGFANIFPMRYTFVADHYVYLASLGILVPAAALVWQLAKPMRLGVAAVLILALTGLTIARAMVFQNPVALWTDAINKNYWSWMVHENMGHAWNNLWQAEPDSSPMKGVYEQKAEAEYLTAERLTPLGVTDVDWGLASFYLKQGRLDEAEAHDDRVLALAPGDGPAWCTKGTIMYERGMMDEAMAMYRKSALMGPLLPEPHFRMGRVYEINRSDDADAEPEYRLALALDPGYLLAHFSLGNILLRAHKYDEAIGEFQAVLNLDANHPEALYNMAACYAFKGDTVNAIACAQAALRLNPNFGPAEQLLQRLGSPGR